MAMEHHPFSLGDTSSFMVGFPLSFVRFRGCIPTLEENEGLELDSLLGDAKNFMPVAFLWNATCLGQNLALSTKVQLDVRCWHGSTAGQKKGPKTKDLE